MPGLQRDAVDLRCQMTYAEDLWQNLSHVATHFQPKAPVSGAD